MAGAVAVPVAEAVLLLRSPAGAVGGVGVAVPVAGRCARRSSSLRRCRWRVLRLRRALASDGAAVCRRCPSWLGPAAG
jgi:hypothetical protein